MRSCHREQREAVIASNAKRSLPSYAAIMRLILAKSLLHRIHAGIRNRSDQSKNSTRKYAKATFTWQCTMKNRSFSIQVSFILQKYTNRLEIFFK